MPWKVILFLIVLVVALLFIGFNLGNRTNISIGFHVWQDVPVFLSMFFSFAFGILAMIPFLVRMRFSKKTRARAQKEPQKVEQLKEEESTEAPPSS